MTLTKSNITEWKEELKKLYINDLKKTDEQDCIYDINITDKNSKILKFFTGMTPEDAYEIIKEIAKNN